MGREEIVTLETLEGGAVLERFNLALQEVLDNINNPNTEWNVAREIKLKFTIKPNESREVCTVKISSDNKLAPISALNTHMFIGKQGDKMVACVRSTRQADMFTEKPLPDNVTPLPKREAQ